jgi:hypothetical protein
MSLLSYWLFRYDLELLYLNILTRSYRLAVLKRVDLVFVPRFKPVGLMLGA